MEQPRPIALLEIQVFGSSGVIGLTKRKLSISNVAISS
ncbi:hypothetical protein ES703_92530 [subsurface metagenome]